MTATRNRRPQTFDTTDDAKPVNAETGESTNDAADKRAQFGFALVTARENAGLTQDDVAAALGLTRQLVSYWEQAKRTPRTEQLFELAHLYRISVDDLVSQRTPARAQSAAMLYRRSNVDLDDPARDGLARYLTFLNFYAELLKAAGRQPAGMTRSPFLPGEGYGEYDADARRKASEVRAHLGLGLGPVSDIDTVCAALGVTVYRAHLGSDLATTISGAFYKHPDLGFTIVINLDMTRGRRRFTAAHELAHALLHSGNEAIIVSDSGRSDQREKYADAFAGEFLMPEEGIRRALEALDCGPKIDDVEPVIHLQRMFRVSYITALVRLRQANIISNATMNQLRTVPPLRTAARMGYNPGDDEGALPQAQSVIARYPARFRTLLRDCLDRELVGRSETEHALGLDNDELDALIGPSNGLTEVESKEWDEFRALGAIA